MMKQEENHVKQEDNQIHYQFKCDVQTNQPLLLSYGYIPIPHTLEIDQYRLTIRQLIEENNHLKHLLKLNQNFQLKALTQDELGREVYKMVYFVMENQFQIPLDQLFQYQKQFPKCSQKRTLKCIYFQIFTRYLQAQKTREEMLKFIIRKCLKHCKSKHEWLEQNIDKTKINGTFVNKLFEKQSFREEYQVFLERYLQIAQSENDSKIRKYVSFLVEQINTDHPKQALEYKRFPWLNIWIQQSHLLAKQLSTESSSSRKKQKKQTLKLADIFDKSV